MADCVFNKKINLYVFNELIKIVFLLISVVTTDVVTQSVVNGISHQPPE